MIPRPTRFLFGTGERSSHERERDQKSPRHGYQSRGAGGGSQTWIRRWSSKKASQAPSSTSPCAADSDHNAFQLTVDLGDQFIQLSLGKTQEADGKRHFGFVVDDRTPVRAALDSAVGRQDPGPAPQLPRPLGQPHRGGALRRRPVFQGVKRAQRHGTRGDRETTPDAIAESVTKKGMAPA